MKIWDSVYTYIHNREPKNPAKIFVPCYSFNEMYFTTLYCSE